MQTHVVSLLDFSDAAAGGIKATASLIVCAVRQQHGEKNKTVGDVFGLCAGQQIGVGLAK